MTFQLSAGVNYSEIDLTGIVPAVGTTTGALVGSFAWGPIDEVRTITNEIELVDIYGKPDANTFVDFFTASNFLGYGRDLRVVRANATSTMLNATSNTTGRLIKNRTDYEENHKGNAFAEWAATYAGELGSSLKVSIYSGTNTANFSSWAYSSIFNGVPGTSTYVSNQNGLNDEMHIAIIDEDGKFSGTANTVLERFSYVSKASDAKRDDGSSNYFVNVINDSSKYIWWMSHPTNNAENWGATAANTTFGGQLNIASSLSLSGGSYNVSTAAEISSGYDKFKNAEDVDISLIMTSGHGTTVVSYVADNIAEYRKDAVFFASPSRANCVNQPDNTTTANNIVSERNALTSTSYGVMDSGWKYQFDKYNNVYRWIPLNGDIAGLCVRTDYDRDPWFSPAGLNRGVIKNAIKLAWNPNKTNRDILYKNGINPVITLPGQGTVLFGDKTMLAKPSAFDRINVRRLFIVLEKAIVKASQYSLFEFNDAFTRAQFVSLVEPYLRDVQGRRGIYDFRVVCNETNNTAEVIDRNEFIGDIYIKPARSINFIQLNFIATRTGVSFDEVVGRV
jgi:phage tail sheath protein FI